MTRLCAFPDCTADISHKSTQAHYCAFHSLVMANRRKAEQHGKVYQPGALIWLECAICGNSFQWFAPTGKNKTLRTQCPDCVKARDDERGRERGDAHREYHERPRDWRYLSGDDSLPAGAEFYASEFRQMRELGYIQPGSTWLHIETGETWIQPGDVVEWGRMFAVSIANIAAP